MIVPLKDVKDAAFSSGAVGKGVAVVPIEGKLYAPAQGTIQSVFPTSHAVGLTTKEGIEVLMHIGLDTVKLNGRFFHSHVKPGDHVEVGQLLISFDRKAIANAGYDLSTPIVITNAGDYLDVVSPDDGNVKPGNSLISIIQ
ncbi:PTS sugar transporter subunit IIA [Desmospora activa]|uniref:Glucose-specific phosphotransferase system IIA component n=1 Tax=Desmospora activa DSM 45169 TaxID=1121389 RepID=A0A2T4Z0I9_9BACL|nr:PTS glucose transporter subunit IIA [Desmospora activa]PTM53251.1 glucose-specific phosphotransferase system IIA component [Desmospora activa DSM 45169]